jgi:penicillin-binding protein 2
VAVLAQHSCSSHAAVPIVRDIVEAYFKKYHPEVIAEAVKKGEKHVKVVAPTGSED